ncbi:MAG: hypothetical protein H0T47_08605 [Planctomycetaceae bacterium]|nr:hypothetical protein [Planctomycetaceae bacterium]
MLQTLNASNAAAALYAELLLMPQRSARIKNIFAAEAKERQIESGGDKKSETAKTVRDNCPQLIKQTKNGSSLTYCLLLPIRAAYSLNAAEVLSQTLKLTSEFFSTVPSTCARSTSCLDNAGKPPANGSPRTPRRSPTA